MENKINGRLLWWVRLGKTKTNFYQNLILFFKFGIRLISRTEISPVMRYICRNQKSDIFYLTIQKALAPTLIFLSFRQSFTLLSSFIISFPQILPFFRQKKKLATLFNKEKFRSSTDYSNKFLLIKTNRHAFNLTQKSISIQMYTRDLLRSVRK